MFCKNDVCYVKTKTGAKIYFDNADRHFVENRYWTERKSANTSYAVTNGGKSNGWKQIAMHTIFMQTPKGLCVDHIDGNGLNNRRSNLRVCNSKQNTSSTRSRKGTSKYKGVSKFGSKWRAYIAPNRKQISLGYFSNQKDAAIAYNIAAEKYFGEFALLNDVSRPGHFVKPGQ